MKMSKNFCGYYSLMDHVLLGTLQKLDFIMTFPLSETKEKEYRRLLIGRKDRGRHSEGIPGSRSGCKRQEKCQEKNF